MCDLISLKASDDYNQKIQGKSLKPGFPKV